MNNILHSANALFVLVGSCLCLACVSGFSQISQNQYRSVDKGDHGEEVELTVPSVVYELTLQPGSRITVDEFGRIGSLLTSAPLTLNGLLFPARSKLAVRETSASDPLLALVHLVSGPQFKFALVQAALGGGARFGPLEFQEGDLLTFSKEQAVELALLSSPRTFGSKSYPGGSEIWFNTAGEVKKSRTKEQRAEADRAYEEQRHRCQGSCAHLASVPGAVHNDCIAACMR